MLDKTLGYILCCQSPALFLAALALLVAYLAGRKHRVKAFFRLLRAFCARRAPWRCTSWVSIRNTSPSAISS